MALTGRGKFPLNSSYAKSRRRGTGWLSVSKVSPLPKVSNTYAPWRDWFFDAAAASGFQPVWARNCNVLILPYGT